MLDGESARKVLEQFKSKRFVEERVSRIASLPEAIRPNARTLFGLDQAEEESIRDSWMRRHERQRKAVAAYRAIPPAALHESIRTVFPELAPYITRALENTLRLPYLAGAGRKPFRSPSMPALLDNARMNFLTSLFTSIGEYPPDIEWIAAWAPFAWPYQGEFASHLLAAAIDENDSKGRNVFDILLASAKGEHEVGQMGRHLVASLLISERPEAWEFMEKMLLAGQREEGLRQSILEMIDEGHPDAFRRFLRVILEHDLVRFSATVRAMDTWFGFLWDAMSAGKAKQIIEHALRFLDDPAAAEAAISAADNLPAAPAAKSRVKKLVEADEAVEPAYIALWSKAFLDVKSALPPAEQLIRSRNTDVRFVATHLLGQTQLIGGVSNAIAGALDDSDDRVAARALRHFSHGHYFDEATQDSTVPDLFERLERLLERAPAKTVRLAPIVWPWYQMPWGKESAGVALISALGKRPAARLLPHLPSFDASTRNWAARKLAESAAGDPSVRDALLKLAGDPSRLVRTTALEYLTKSSVSEAEAPQFEALLTRTASDLRQAVITLLYNQTNAAALASADRLSAAKNELQRLGGLELFRRLAGAGREADACRIRAAAYRDAHPKLSTDERTQIDALDQPATDSATLDDCLGLIDPSARTKPLVPTARRVTYVSTAAIGLLQGLDELVHLHREDSFTPVNHAGAMLEPVLIGNVRWEFPRVDHEKPIRDQALPYREIWFPWFESRPKTMRDADALEIARAKWLAQFIHMPLDGGEKPVEWLNQIKKSIVGDERPPLRYPGVVLPLLDWLGALHPSAVQSAFLLDGLENILAQLPKEKLTETRKMPWGNREETIWRGSDSIVMKWLAFIEQSDVTYSPAEAARYYQLCRWIDEPGVSIPRRRADLSCLLSALDAGGANEADIYDHFIGAREDENSYRSHSELGDYCSLKPQQRLIQHAALMPIIDRCRDRVLEIELKRGETPTCVSNFAASLKHAGGLDVLVSFLRVAEKNTFSRGFSWANTSKAVVFSGIIRGTFPAESETPDRFSAQVKTAAIPESRLLELATYAPQWAEHVEQTLGWKGLEEAVWWIHAHTRDRKWFLDEGLREKWRAQVARRTPLDSDDLLDGAVDVAWFRRTHETLGEKRWKSIYNVAKYAASGGGHARAQLFADAMLGEIKADDLVKRIEAKRHQDSVRALGLIPLPDAEQARAQILSRYRTLQGFVRTSRKFGSMRQVSERRAATVGMENLARTAGFPDPIRLQWAMEAESCADLARGPVVVTVGETSVSLSISEAGEPEIFCAKKGKTLAAVPAALKKDPQIAELAARKTDLKRSHSRMRGGLEQAMVRGDQFSSEELRDLLANPLLAPMLVRLVFIGEGVMGYPVDKGRGLMDYAGKIEPLKKSERLRLAHSHDFLIGGHWSEWQRDCFKRERVQPFKQIFRELYVLTATESDAKECSRRYAGHQVQPRQALALLGSRGWIASPEEGVFRVFHDLGLTAWLTFQQAFFTPADIEGLTLEDIRFTRRSDPRDWVQLSDLPPRLFSEVMRDIDLAVSVAHRGAIDPEASASTIQMRTALLSETTELLGINNVRVKESHAFIKGELADYMIHLGSAVTHRQPGGALFVVAVHSQHRGRLFLPFADDDPKTAEVISKVLLLARDRDIKDPNLLAQIRERR